MVGVVDSQDHSLSGLHRAASFCLRWTVPRCGNGAYRAGGCASPLFRARRALRGMIGQAGELVMFCIFAAARTLSLFSMLLRARASFRLWRA